MAGTAELRILPLIASATEIVCALGLRDYMIGRSHECDYPPDVRSLPQVTTPKFPCDGSSADIDKAVKDALRDAETLDALGVYEVSADALRELRPTHIVTQAHCEVCAVSQRDVEVAVGRVTGCEPRIVSLQPNALADVWSGFEEVSRALGVDPAGVDLAKAVRRRIKAVAERAADIGTKPSVAAIEWISPLMSVGNWVPELIEGAGGRCLHSRPGEHSPYMAFEALRDSDPDVIVVCPCGFPIARTLEERSVLESYDGWGDLRAVRTGRVYVADGNQYFNRPGPRLAESVEILAEIIHPDHFDHGHRGTGWAPLA